MLRFVVVAGMMVAGTGNIEIVVAGMTSVWDRGHCDGHSRYDCGWDRRR